MMTQEILVNEVDVVSGREGTRAVHEIRQLKGEEVRDQCERREGRGYDVLCVVRGWYVMKID